MAIYGQAVYMVRKIRPNELLLDGPSKNCAMSMVFLGRDPFQCGYNNFTQHKCSSRPFSDYTWGENHENIGLATI